MSNIYASMPVSKKYDSTLDYHITMYDNLPYKRNADLCGAQQLGLYSGHIIKYYLCLNNEDSYKINNHDDNIQEILSHIKAENEKIIQNQDIEVVSNNNNGITQEQIQTLLDDPDESQENDSSEEVVSSNAFEGIEDW